MRNLILQNIQPSGTDCLAAINPNEICHTKVTSALGVCDYQNTVWPEILAGNLFWRIGGFESNPPMFYPPKTSV